MRIDYSPDYVTMAISLAIAAVCFTAAMVITIRRRERDLRPGAAVWLLLGLSALALAAAWDAV